MKSRGGGGGQGRGPRLRRSFVPIRAHSLPSGKGPVEYFTGTVRIDPLFQAPDPARVVDASVTFEPGLYLSTVVAVNEGLARA